MWKAGGVPVLITRDGKHWPLALRDGVPVFKSPVPCTPAGSVSSQDNAFGDDVPETPEVTTYKRVDKNATCFRTLKGQTPLQGDPLWPTTSVA